MSATIAKDLGIETRTVEAHMANAMRKLDAHTRAEAVAHALFSPTPKEHYMVVPEQQQAGWTIQKALEEVVRLNEGHQFSYTREELIQMLDKLLETSATP